MTEINKESKKMKKLIEAENAIINYLAGLYPREDLNPDDLDALTYSVIVTPMTYSGTDKYTYMANCLDVMENESRELPLGSASEVPLGSASVLTYSGDTLPSRLKALESLESSIWEKHPSDAEKMKISETLIGSWLSGFYSSEEFTKEYEVTYRVNTAPTDYGTGYIAMALIGIKSKKNMDVLGIISTKSDNHTNRLNSLYDLNRRIYLNHALIN